MKITKQQLRKIIKEEVRNYYSDLEVNRGQPTSDLAAIKKSYRKQALKHHPDRGGDEEKMKAVNAAGQTLLKPEKKKKYDQELYKDTMGCKKEDPNANFCGETGVALSDEALKGFAEIAGISQSSSTNAGASQGSSANAESKLDFWTFKTKIMTGIMNQSQAAVDKGDFDSMMNFMKLANNVIGLMEKDIEELKHYKDFLKYAS